MRTFKFSTDTWLHVLGSMAKGLFSAMIVTIVTIILIAAFGAMETAAILFWIIWAVFWRACLTLIALSAITTLLGIWSPKQRRNSTTSILQRASSKGGDNIINFQRHYFRRPKTSHKPQP